MVCLLIGQTAAVVLLSYGDYFPPNFRSDFLLGRSQYFFGAYQWAFYAHIVSGPFTLIAGLALMSERFRRHVPHWHRRVGRLQIACVLLLLVPSGFWMAWYAARGAMAVAGFATLAVATAATAVMGWRTAVKRRFVEHAQWMQRCYALLCSAVVLRVIGGASDLFDAGWTYPYAAWVSWLLPLMMLEFARRCPRVLLRLQSSA